MATEGPLNLSDILTEDQIRNFSKNQLQFFFEDTLEASLWKQARSYSESNPFSTLSLCK